MTGTKRQHDAEDAAPNYNQVLSTKRRRYLEKEQSNPSTASRIGQPPPTGPRSAVKMPPPKPAKEQPSTAKERPRPAKEQLQPAKPQPHRRSVSSTTVAPLEDYVEKTLLTSINAYQEVHTLVRQLYDEAAALDWQNMKLQKSVKAYQSLIDGKDRRINDAENEKLAADKKVTKAEERAEKAEERAKRAAKDRDAFIGITVEQEREIVELKAALAKEKERIKRAFWN